MINIIQKCNFLWYNFFMKKTYFLIAALTFYAASFCSCANVKTRKIEAEFDFINKAPRVILGDEQSEKYLPMVKDKKVALFSNHSGIMGDKIILQDGRELFGGNEIYGTSEEAADIPFGLDADGNKIKRDAKLNLLQNRIGIEVGILF